MESESYESLMQAWISGKKQSVSAQQISLAGMICQELQASQSYAQLEEFTRKELEGSKLDGYKTDERVYRAMISVFMQRKDYDEVQRLLENFPFRNGDDLVDVWDEAHYQAKFKRDNKPLTPLIKFRLRKKYPPPVNILPSQIRNTSSLSESAKQVLESWFRKHPGSPYPTFEEKQELSKESCLTMTQVRTWFANLRRRLKKKGVVNFVPVVGNNRRCRDPKSTRNKIKKYNQQSEMTENVTSSHTVTMTTATISNHTPASETSLFPLSPPPSSSSEYRYHFSGQTNNWYGSTQYYMTPSSGYHHIPSWDQFTMRPSYTLDNYMLPPSPAAPYTAHHYHQSYSPHCNLCPTSINHGSVHPIIGCSFTPPTLACSVSESPSRCQQSPISSALLTRPITVPPTVLSSNSSADVTCQFPRSVLSSSSTSTQPDHVMIMNTFSPPDVHTESNTTNITTRDSSYTNLVPYNNDVIIQQDLTAGE
ncbi:uncharacterized protein LOC144355825 [Saccoglossus kowalevskii]